ncbi:MAG: hypothetical protein WKF41_17165 [Gaiellaceae bacterium]
MKDRKVWVPDEGWKLESETTAEDLRRVSDYRWTSGRPSETLKGISRAKKPQVRRGAWDLADVERLILADQWIGDTQRGVMLQEVRLLAQFAASRKEREDA